MAAPVWALLTWIRKSGSTRCFVHLGTGTAGLSGREAERRPAQFRANEITRTEKASRLRELARQLAHPLALLSWVAAAVAGRWQSDACARDCGGDPAQRHAALCAGASGRARHRGAQGAATAARAGAPGRPGAGDPGVGARSAGGEDLGERDRVPPCSSSSTPTTTFRFPTSEPALRPARSRRLRPSPAVSRTAGGRRGAWRGRDRARPEDRVTAPG